VTLRCRAVVPDIHALSGWQNLAVHAVSCRRSPKIQTSRSDRQHFPDANFLPQLPELPTRNGRDAAGRLGERLLGAL